MTKTAQVDTGKMTFLRTETETGTGTEKIEEDTTGFQLLALI